MFQMPDVHEGFRGAPPDDPSHGDLIGSARRIREMARHPDLRALTAALEHLRQDLADHVGREARDIDRLPGATPALARSGQENLIDLLDRILHHAHGHDTLDCALATVELETRLRRQARLEAALHLHVLAGTDQSR